MGRKIRRVSLSRDLGETILYDEGGGEAKGENDKNRTGAEEADGPEKTEVEVNFSLTGVLLESPPWK